MQHLAISEAAVLLGKSERQVRYLIKRGQLEASKVGGQWRIPSNALPLTDDQRETMLGSAQRIVDAAESAVAPARKAASGSDKRRRFSVQNLRVFRVAMELYREAVETCGGNAQATLDLHSCLIFLARGCHTYQSRAKAEHFCAAREAAASALVELLIVKHSDDASAHNAIADRIEQELMGPFSGLIRTAERKRRRGRFERFGQGG